MANTVKSLSADVEALKTYAKQGFEQLIAIIKEQAEDIKALQEQVAVLSKATSSVNVNPRTHSQVEWKQQQEQRSAARANTTLEVRQLAGEMARECAMREKRTVRVEDFYSAAATKLAQAAVEEPPFEELDDDDTPF